VGVLVDDHFAGVGVEHQHGRRPQVDGFMRLGFLRLREADGDGENEEQGKDGNDALERMEFSLHCGESSLAGGLFVIGCSCSDWSTDASESALRKKKTQTKSGSRHKFLESV